MKVVVADTGALISLGHVRQLTLIEKVFGEFYISGAVWEELQAYEHPTFEKSMFKGLKIHVINIKSKNHLSVIMDYGESESIILYDELEADYLLIDDNKARTIAESLGVNCIGSIGLLIKAKQKGLLKELKPIFENWLENRRYFSKRLLNKILNEQGEHPL